MYLIRGDGFFRDAPREANSEWLRLKVKVASLLRSEGESQSESADSEQSVTLAVPEELSAQILLLEARMPKVKDGRMVPRLDKRLGSTSE